VASRKAGLARAIKAGNKAVAERLTASVARAQGRLARIKARAARNGQKKAA